MQKVLDAGMPDAALYMRWPEGSEQVTPKGGTKPCIEVHRWDSWALSGATEKPPPFCSLGMNLFLKNCLQRAF